MTHLTLNLPTEPIDFDTLTFPKITTAMVLVGPFHYLVVPTEREDQLHGAGEGFTWEEMAAYSLWRSETAPAAEVLAEVAEFNADPRRGWANLIREAAVTALERRNREVQEAKARATAALLLIEGADDILDPDDEGDELHL